MTTSLISRILGDPGESVCLSPGHLPGIITGTAYLLGVIPLSTLCAKSQPPLRKA